MKQTGHRKLTWVSYIPLLSTKTLRHYTQGGLTSQCLVPSSTSYRYYCISIIRTHKLSITTQNRYSINDLLGTSVHSSYVNITIYFKSVYLLAYSLAKVAATTKGNTKVASAYTLTCLAPALILPQEIASSGRAPASEPSNSWPVLI